MSKSDNDFFNCGQDHEYEYVIYKKYERNKNTTPTAKDLEDFIKQLCDENNNMTHDFLYEKIEEEYPELKDY